MVGERVVPHFVRHFGPFGGCLSEGVMLDRELDLSEEEPCPGQRTRQILDRTKVL
jgi:hypothetical protein